MGECEKCCVEITYSLHSNLLNLELTAAVRYCVLGWFKFVSSFSCLEAWIFVFNQILSACFGRFLA